MADEDIPVVPCVWPLGHGCVMTSYDYVPENGLFFFMRAVPDRLIGEPGTFSDQETWDSLHGYPTLTLHFKDLAALENHISSLKKLADLVNRDVDEN